MYMKLSRVSSCKFVVDSVLRFFKCYEVAAVMVCNLTSLWVQGKIQGSRKLRRKRRYL